MCGNSDGLIVLNTSKAGDLLSSLIDGVYSCVCQRTVIRDFSELPERIQIANII